VWQFIPRAWQRGSRCFYEMAEVEALFHALKPKPFIADEVSEDWNMPKG
jgi:hypothetical protein